MGSKEIPTLYFLDPGFIGFCAVCAGVYGIWWLVQRFR